MSKIKRVDKKPNFHSVALGEAEYLELIAQSELDGYRIGHHLKAAVRGYLRMAPISNETHQPPDFHLNVAIDKYLKNEGLEWSRAARNIRKKHGEENNHQAQ